jgi:hypothetical protein
MSFTYLTARSGAQPRCVSVTKQFELASLLFITFILLFAGRAHAFSQIVAFGDSLSENGNAFALSGGRYPLHRRTTRAGSRMAQSGSRHSPGISVFRSMIMR